MVRIQGLIIFFLICLSIGAQTVHKTEAKGDLIVYGDKDPIPIGSITNIVQTKDDYIWISGIDGTVRFNGYEFDFLGKDFGVDNSQYVYYDSLSNMLYFASASRFITFDGNNFNVYTEKEGYRLNGLSGQVISMIYKDSKGNVWIGSTTPFVEKRFNGGLTRFDGKNFKVYTPETFPLDNVTSCLETPQGDLIFTSDGYNTISNAGSYIALYQDGAFARIDETKGVSLVNAFFGNADETYIDDEGNVWIACMGVIDRENIFLRTGVLMYDGRKFHQFENIKKYIKKGAAVSDVFYSKEQKTVIASLGSETGFNTSTDISTFKFSEGEWIPYRLFDSKNTDHNIRYSAAIFFSEELFGKETIALVSSIGYGSATEPNHYFTFEEGGWNKFDAIHGIPFIKVREGILFEDINGNAFSFYYPNNSELITAEDGLLSTETQIGYSMGADGMIWRTYSFVELTQYTVLPSLGLNIWDGQKLHTFTEENGLTDNDAFEPVYDGSNRVLVPTQRGVTLFTSTKNADGQREFHPKKIKSKGGTDYDVSNILAASNGDIYAYNGSVRPGSAVYPGAKSGFYVLQNEVFEELPFPFESRLKDKPFQSIRMYETNSGMIWIEGVFAATEEGLHNSATQIMVKDGNNWKAAPAEWEIPKKKIYFVGELKSGRYYLALDGFYKFDGKRFINLSDSVNTKADFTLLKQASLAGTRTEIKAGDYLYIRIRGRGLVIFDGTNLKYYTSKNGLTTTDIHNPIISPDGKVFFANSSGGLIIKGEEFFQVSNNDLVSSANPHSVLQDAFGNIVHFYANVGMTVRRTQNTTYPLKISSVKAGSNSYNLRVPDRYSYSDNSFLFNYSLLGYQDPSNVKYEHILEGFDKEWSKGSSLSFAEYQNLPPGKYNFKVRALQGYGSHSGEAAFAFVIHPPLWKTWWAYMLYGLMFFGLLYSIRKFEMKRQKNKASILEAQLRAEAAELQVKTAEAQARLVQIENERKTHELEEARKLQLSMLPKFIPQLPNLDIAVYMKTATEVGGDYYDFHVHLDGTLTVLLGDATGHGMQSGMMVSIMKSLFMSDRSSKDLKPFFHNSNHSIKDMQLGRLMMALSCVQFNSNSVKIANAGMPSILIYRNESRQVEEVAINNLPLGSIKNFEFEIVEKNIYSGDTLLMMSDGFPELTNINEEMMGYTRTRNYFEEAAHLSPEVIVEQLKDRGKEWNIGKDNEDDVTFVVIKVK